MHAAGTQVYPTGLSKYYDLFSWDGYWVYLGDWFLYWLYICLTPFTLFIPLNIWIGMFGGLTWDGIWKLLIPSPITMMFRITGENGWPLY